MLPRSVKVGGKTYKIKWEKEPPKYFGKVEYDKNTIYLCTSLKNSPTMEFNVILHELLHAICKDRDIKQTEEMINGLANGITAVLISNPSLRKHLNTLLEQ